MSLAAKRHTWRASPRSAALSASGCTASLPQRKCEFDLLADVIELLNE